MPEFYVIFVGNINKIPEFYMIFVQEIIIMPEFLWCLSEKNYQTSRILHDTCLKKCPNFT